jgi:hypothetical protein
MFKLDFGKIGDLATLLKAGLTIDVIRTYAEVVETAPDLPKDADLEDIKKAAEIKDFEAPKAEEPKKEDPISTLRGLVSQKEE